MEIIKEQFEVRQYNGKLDFKDIPELKLVEAELMKAVSDTNGTVRDMCIHILDAGGKRIRPLLVIYSGLIFGENTPELLQTAVAAELIHMASLIHDDIVDNSVLRRSRPSINSIWGNNFAVLGGDYLFAKAFGILSSKNLNCGMEYMVEAIQSMCGGEIVQAEDRFNCDCSLEEYYEKIACKTAILLKCCCQAGAAAQNAAQEEIELIGEYGLNLGLAFQITDDILDLCGSSELTGKPKREDLRQGIISMPIIYLLGNKANHHWVKNVIEERKFDDDTISKICSVIAKTGIMEKCYDRVRIHIEKAQKSLDNLPDSYHKEILYRLADMVYARMN
ncbi:polyprenyl synthetase family protein [Pseudobacteroides cellulosolvens]|uniref:Trans-hexaprenyltranstransferase n=1 Tax=Pseudobacteroides cellulosolvens ATCC 35603 = DSM 2933 TaxID=398512 RepID=A0A0L6JTL9_9FIRM|nr:polyprenyl synthetase family protein [Pseudobacteroides cellulosolvens]KNY28747.1 Trans-hexaprenyltranstransferase [Pseudobacteroides cellulosolvens ATCC 35603 = DSM 2933]